MSKNNNLTRRTFFQLSATALSGMCFAGVNCCKKETAKTTIPIGMQLYCVRHECKEDLPGTIAKVAQMGYQGVEFADYFGYSAPELRKMLDDNNLQCCGTHILIETLQGDELEKTIEFNKILGNKYLIVRSLDHNVYNSKEKWIEVSGIFNTIAEKVKPHGMKVGYHNHGYEYNAIDGEIPWDIFADNTSKDVIMQLDTGNCSNAGADALHYLKRNPGRTATCHLKPYSTTHENAIIGEDELDWKEIIKTCETTAGVEWYIIEYEKKGIEPLQAMKMNLESFKKLLG